MLSKAGLAIGLSVDLTDAATFMSALNGSLLNRVRTLDIIRGVSKSLHAGRASGDRGTGRRSVVDVHAHRVAIG